MGSSVVETTGKKKLSGTAKGYIILVGLVVLSWAIFKVLTPGNFGSPANMLSYFQASLIATGWRCWFLLCYGYGYVRLLHRREHHAFSDCRLCICLSFRHGICRSYHRQRADWYHCRTFKRYFLCKTPYPVHDCNDGSGSYL